MSRALLLSVLLSWTTGIVSAHAQAPSSSPDGSPVSVTAAQAPVATPADIVRLTNGGFVRGTLQEYIPDSHVVLLTSAGEFKRFAAAEVVFAGSAHDDPQAAPRQPVRFQEARQPLLVEGSQPEAGRVRIAFKSGNGHAHRLYRLEPALYGPGAHAAPGLFTPVCTAPCEAQIPSETQLFAVGAVSEGRPIVVREPLSLSGDRELISVYRSRRAIRIAGRVLSALSVAMLVGAVFSVDGEANPLTLPLAVGGGALAIGGLIMMMQFDSAKLTVNAI